MNRARLSCGGMSAVVAMPAGKVRSRLASPLALESDTSCVPENEAMTLVGSVPSTTSIFSRLPGHLGGVGQLQVVGDVVLAVGPEEREGPGVHGREGERGEGIGRADAADLAADVRTLRHGRDRRSACRRPRWSPGRRRSPSTSTRRRPTPGRPGDGEPCRQPPPLAGRSCAPGLGASCVSCLSSVMGSPSFVRARTCRCDWCRCGWGRCGWCWQRRSQGVSRAIATLSRSTNQSSAFWCDQPRPTMR